MDQTQRFFVAMTHQLLKSNDGSIIWEGVAEELNLQRNPPAPMVSGEECRVLWEDILLRNHTGIGNETMFQPFPGAQPTRKTSLKLSDLVTLEFAKINLTQNLLRPPTVSCPDKGSKSTNINFYSILPAACIASELHKRNIIKDAQDAAIAKKIKLESKNGAREKQSSKMEMPGIAAISTDASVSASVGSVPMLANVDNKTNGSASGVHHVTVPVNESAPSQPRHAGDTSNARSEVPESSSSPTSVSPLSSSSSSGEPRAGKEFSINATGETASS